MDRANPCRHCGHDNPAARFFCQGCGRPLAAAASPPGPSAATRPSPAPSGASNSLEPVSADATPPAFVPSRATPGAPGGRGTAVATVLVTAVGLLLVVALVAGGALAVLSGARSTDSAASGDAAGEAQGEAIKLAESGEASGTPAARVGASAPEIKLKELTSGREVALSRLRGRPVVVTFFATWCGPCRQEMPVMEKARQANQDKDLVVLAVNVADDRGAEAARQFLQSLGTNFTAVRDETGVVGHAYQVTSIPTTFFVDRAGVIRDKQIGAASAATLAKRIKAIL